MGGLRIPLLVSLALCGSCMTTAASVTLRLCSESEVSRRTPCLRRWQDKRCQRVHADQGSRGLGVEGQAVPIVSSELVGRDEEGGPRNKVHLRWSPEGSLKRRRLIIMVKVSRGGTADPLVSCFHVKRRSVRGKKRNRRSQPDTIGRRGTGQRRRQRQSSRAGPLVDIEIPIDGDYHDMISGLILEERKRKNSNVIRRRPRILGTFRLPATPDHLTTNSIDDLPAPSEVPLKISDLHELPASKCRSIYTDRTFRDADWSQTRTFNVTTAGTAHNLVVQCDLPGKKKGYLIITEVLYENATQSSNYTCFYFCPSALKQRKLYQQPSTSKVKMDFDVIGNYSETRISVLEGPLVKKAKNFFEKKRDYVILEKFKKRIGRGSYVVPSPSTQNLAPAQALESCYSWKLSSRLPYNWYRIQGGWILEVAVCPSNQLARKPILYLTPKTDITHVVSQVPLSREKCVGNLTVPTNDTYGTRWNIMLTWDCQDCPQEARLNRGDCKSRFLKVDDSVTTPPARKESPAIAKWEQVVAGVCGGLLIIGLMVLLVRWRKERRKQSPCPLSQQRLLNPLLPPGKDTRKVSNPRSSAFIIYWPDHDYHRKATVRLAAMMRCLGLEVALDVESPDEIRRVQKPTWVQSKLRSGHIVIVASRGLLRASRLLQQGRDPANDTDDQYAAMAPLALRLLAQSYFTHPSPRRQQVFLVSFGYDLACVEELRQLLYTVSLRTSVLAARPRGEDEGERGDGEKTTNEEENWDLFGFFCQLNGSQDRAQAQAVAQSEDARHFERNRQGMQRVRRSATSAPLP